MDLHSPSADSSMYHRFNMVRLTVTLFPCCHKTASFANRINLLISTSVAPFSVMLESGDSAFTTSEQWQKVQQIVEFIKSQDGVGEVTSIMPLITA